MPNCTWLLSLLCFVFNPELGFDLFASVCFYFWNCVPLNRVQQWHFSSALSFSHGDFFELPFVCLCILFYLNYTFRHSKLCLLATARLTAPPAVRPKRARSIPSASTATVVPPETTTQMDTSIDMEALTATITAAVTSAVQAAMKTPTCQ